MAKKKKKKDDGAGSSWMASYTDLVTVLFALFVMLYALSEVDEELWAQFVLAAAFNPTIHSPFDIAGQGINELVGSGIMTLPDFNTVQFERPEMQDQNQVAADAMQEIVEELRTYFGEVGFGDNITAEFEDGRITLTTHGDVYFDAGRSTIRPEIFHILDAIGLAIQEIPNVEVTVEGHTDSDPINTAVYPSNWRLSSARAQSVAEHFMYTMGVIEPDRVDIRGRGEYHPVADNATAEGRQANRRVVIILQQADTN